MPPSRKTVLTTHRGVVCVLLLKCLKLLAIKMLHQHSFNKKKNGELSIEFPLKYDKEKTDKIKKLIRRIINKEEKKWERKAEERKK